MARQVDGLIWQVREDGNGTSEVAVRRDALAAILPLAEAGLAHVDIDAAADLCAAVSYFRAILSDDGDAGSAGSLAPA